MLVYLLSGLPCQDAGFRLDALPFRVTVPKPIALPNEVIEYEPMRVEESGERVDPSSSSAGSSQDYGLASVAPILPWPMRDNFLYRDPWGDEDDTWWT